jgi:hypothetical protein
MNEIQICQPKGTDSFETFLLAPGKVVLRSAGGVSADYSMQASAFRSIGRAQLVDGQLCSGYTEGTRIDSGKELLIWRRPYSLPERLAESERRLLYLLPNRGGWSNT